MTEIRSQQEPSAQQDVDGTSPIETIQPETAAETAEILGQAAASEQAVAPQGGGVHLALGNSLDRPAITLSTLKMSGIIEYEPTDLVVAVHAGTRFGELQQALGEHGQWLPIEAPDDDRATVGGLLATALNGPRQLGSGSLRDLLIGMSVAMPDGTVAKAGGMVVKNVTGFDMARLHFGALGTLGVITSANFKVLPRPKGERTVLVDVAEADERIGLKRVLEMSAAIRRSPLGPVALEIFKDESAWTLAARFEGRPETFDMTTDRFAQFIGAEPARLINADESSGWWRTYLGNMSLEIGPNEALLAIQARPHETSGVADKVLFDTGWRGAKLTSITMSPGFGRIKIRLTLDAADAAEQFGDVIGNVRGHVPRTTIQAAPEAWKRDIDVWGEPDESVALMRTIRDQFDPGRILNPGRFLKGV